MPELPDVAVYLECLRPRVLGRPLERLEVLRPFLLRTVDPPPSELEGRAVVGLRRLGKRVVLELEQERFAVLHLMIAGRLRWRTGTADPPKRSIQATFHFPQGRLHVTEAGTRRRAALFLVRGEAELARHDPGGLEVLQADLPAFAAALAAGRHTLKRALCHPRILSGIGNAYSDEILHRARLSPFKRTGDLSSQETGRLYEAARAVLREWTERLRAEVGAGFPEKVTAFREGMAVHGRYREPCPECGSPVQRIVHAEHETNYCPTCQTEGRLLADRALSRLLRDDWPRTLEEWEELRRPRP